MQRKPLRLAAPRWAAKRVGALLATVVLALSPAVAIAGDAAGADEMWSSRAIGELEGRPRLEPVEQAIAQYEASLLETPDSLEIRWKLLRALHFAGEFAATESPQKRRYFDRACLVADEGVDRVRRQGDSRESLEDQEPEEIRERVTASGLARQDVARFYFWSAINWGAWSREAGLFGAVRNGIGNRLHQYTLVTIALEPDYDEGAAYRLLGRLHAQLPKVPLLTGWVDRDEALPLIEEAYAQGPSHLGNQLLLALTLLDLAPARQTEALALLEKVEASTPRPETLVEDLAIQKEAHAALLSARASGAS